MKKSAYKECLAAVKMYAEELWPKKTLHVYDEAVEYDGAVHHYVVRVFESYKSSGNTKQVFGVTANKLDDALEGAVFALQGMADDRR